MEQEMKTSYPSKFTLSNQPPRTRAVLEFVEGDLSRPPIIFPEAGGEEADRLLRVEILKRWANAR
jgi:hypothetical protein